MALRRQSFALWSVLVLVGLFGCAGRGEIGDTGRGGNSGTGNGGSGGSSVQCAASQTQCGSVCKDLSADQQNCGACGNACGTGQACQAGQCQCSAGLLACNGACVASDASHCGGCSTTCAGGQVCSNNSCQASCGAGETMCAGGACVNVMNNALNCGTCGTQCPAGSVCNGGACGCSASGQMLCGNACVDVMSDGAHCGACNRPCNGACTNGQCVVTPVSTTLLPARIRRITNAEYDASVQALLGTTMTPSAPSRFRPTRGRLSGRLHAERRAARRSRADKLDTPRWRWWRRRAAGKLAAGAVREPDGRAARRARRRSCNRSARRSTGGPWPTTRSTGWSSGRPPCTTSAPTATRTTTASTC